MSGRHAKQMPWELLVILACQAAFTLPLILHRAVYGDEALYLWAGHLEIDHWLDGSHIPSFPGYFSGAPVMYPPLDAATGSLGGARLLAADDGSGDTDESSVGHVLYLGGGNNPHAVQTLAMKSHGMRSDRQAGVREIRLQAFDRIHRG